MNALLYLAAAIAVSVLAISVLVVRNRRPKSMEAGMREFEKGLRALEPADPPARRTTRGGRPG